MDMSGMTLSERVARLEMVVKALANNQEKISIDLQKSVDEFVVLCKEIERRITAWSSDPSTVSLYKRNSPPCYDSCWESTTCNWLFSGKCSAK